MINYFYFTDAINDCIKFKRNIENILSNIFSEKGIIDIILKKYDYYNEYKLIK